MKNSEDEIVQQIGDRIRELRTSKKISQFTLAIQIGISENQLSRIERAESNPTIRTLYKIAKALGVDVKDLID